MPIDATPPQDALTVLVVDDERVNRMWAVGMIRRLAHRAVEACCGEEALEVFASEDVDIVLLDVVMPGMDGFETATRLRDIQPGRWVPIVWEYTRDLRCYLSWLWGDFLTHFGGTKETFINVPDRGLEITVGKLGLQIAPTHYTGAGWVRTRPSGCDVMRFINWFDELEVTQGNVKP